MNFKFVNIVLLIILCIICSFTDIKYGLIKNKVLIILGVPIFMNNCIINYIEGYVKDVGYLFSIFISLIICLVLYYNGIWAGGDCKMNMIVCVSLPYFVAHTNIHGINGEIRCILYSFGIAFIYIIIETIVLDIKNHKKSDISFLEVKNNFFGYIKLFFILFFINTMVEYAFRILEFECISITLFIDFIVLRCFKKLDILKYRCVFLSFLIADIVLDIEGISNMIQVRTFILWLLIILMQILKSYVSGYSYKTIKCEDLERGMILSTMSSYLLIYKNKLDFIKISDETSKSRLSENQIDKIKKFCINQQADFNIKIVRNVPFAMFICISVIIILCEG